jgi:hypothetical protein
MLRLIDKKHFYSDNGADLPYSIEVVPRLFQALVCWFPDSQLLVRMVVAQDMWWWLHRICGGRVLEETKLRLTQPSLVDLGLGLSLAKSNASVHIQPCHPVLLLLSSHQASGCQTPNQQII